MSELVGVRFTAEKLAEIEAWWRAQGAIRNRVDAIRVLVDEGLDAVRRKEGVKLTKRPKD